MWVSITAAIFDPGAVQHTWTAPAAGLLSCSFVFSNSIREVRAALPPASTHVSRTLRSLLYTLQYNCSLSSRAILSALCTQMEVVAQGCGALCLSHAWLTCGNSIKVLAQIVCRHVLLLQASKRLA